ncbi:hypothetical protein [Nocardioides sp.]|uniref:hypothetical protein n=1 Tax=Nocardioides sp. TaxID=35761 RepID=UPI003511D1C5
MRRTTRSARARLERRHAARHDRHDRDDRGAVVAMVALLLVALIGSTAFAVDLGMQRVVRRDAQALADIVALDLARLLDGRTAAQVLAGDSTHPSLATARDQSLARNPRGVVGAAPTVEVRLVTLDATGAPVLDPTGLPAALTGQQVPKAVWVKVRGSIPFAFERGSGAASRTAIGQSTSVACLQVGSFVAAVNSGQGAVLDRYLNDALDLSIASYAGLVDAAVNLRRLQTALLAGTTGAGLDYSRISLGSLFRASATALRADGGQAADITLLESLATKVAASAVIDLRQVVDLSTGNAALLASSINVLDLVAISGFLANGNNLLSLPVLWNVPQFSNGMTSLQVIEGPQRACGEPGATTARTAQITLRALPELNIPTIAGLTAAKVVADTTISLASASASLTGVRCGAGTLGDPQEIRAQVSRSLSTSRVDIPIRLTGDIKTTDFLGASYITRLLTSLGKLTAKVTVDLTIQAGATLASPTVSTAATYAVPPRSFTDPERIGGTGGYAFPHVVIDAADVTGTVTIKGLLGTSVINLSTLTFGTDFSITAILDDLVQKSVIDGINGYLDNLNAELVPLSTMFGLQVAGADLYGVMPPICAFPALRG